MAKLFGSISVGNRRSIGLTVLIDDHILDRVMVVSRLQGGIPYEDITFTESEFDAIEQLIKAYREYKLKPKKTFTNG